MVVEQMVTVASEHDRPAWRRLLPWVWTVLAIALTVVLAVDRHEFPIFAVFPAVFTVLGAMILTRQPGNRIAWLLIAVGVGILAEPLAEMRIDGPPISPDLLDVFAITALQVSFFIFFVLPVTLLLYLFPTGRARSRRWSWAVPLTFGVAGGFVFASLFTSEVGIGDWLVDNPIGFIPLDGWAHQILTRAAGVGLVILMLGGIPAIIVRYRRSSMVERTQIKWIAYTMAIWSGAFLIDLFTDVANSVSVVVEVATLAIPISIALAIMRYRLFEIDRLVSRTVGYLVVVGVLALVYVAGAVWLPTRLLGEQSPLFVAGSTLAMAALFNPLRRKVIVAVDRRFNRSRYDAEHVVAEFGTHLKNETDVEQLTRDSMAVISRTVQPASMGAWIRE